MKCAVYKHLFKTLRIIDATKQSVQARSQHQGRPTKGHRNKLAQRVFDDILKHWNEPAGSDLCKGQAALELLYREKPGDYLKLTASVLPKEFVFENEVTELDDEELDRMIRGTSRAGIVRSPGTGARIEGRNRKLCRMDDTDPAKLEAALERLKAEQARRLQAKIDSVRWSRSRR